MVSRIRFSGNWRGPQLLALLLSKSGNPYVRCQAPARLFAEPLMPHGATRRLACLLVRNRVLGEVAIDLVGRDLMEAKSRPRDRCLRKPKQERCFRQHVSAIDIGAKKGARRVDRTVDMAFRSQVVDGVRLMFGKRWGGRPPTASQCAKVVVAFTSYKGGVHGKS